MENANDINSNFDGNKSDLQKSFNFSLNGRHFFQYKLLPLFIFFMGFMAMSPVFAHFGWRGIFSLFIMLIVSSVFLFSTSLKLKKWFIFLALLIFISSTVTGLYWVDIRYILANVFLIGALFLLQFSTEQVIDKTVTIATGLIIILLIGAVIGLVLALSGTSPLFDFPNPDTRPNYFFYTTLTNSFIGDLIRPSGIYDEPGALSFYVCAVAVMRHMLGKDNKITWAILLLGFVTLSLAHLIYVLFHFLAERITTKNIKAFFLISIFSVSVVYLAGFNTILEDKLFQRLVVSEDTGTIEGDNRSFRMINAINLMSESPKIVFFGADPSCRFDYQQCKQLFPPIGENPLAPMFINGFFVTWPYYISLIVFFLSPVFGKKYFVVFGFGLLLLQRPSMLGISGAMVSSLILLIVLSSVRHRVRLKPSLNYMVSSLFVMQEVDISHLCGLLANA